MLSPDQVSTARTYLEHLLLDSVGLFEKHLATLERFYGGHFKAPLPRMCHWGIDLPRPEPAAEFRHSTLLPEALAMAVVEGGVDRLPEDELARLLLDPYALWDLFDLINSQWSDYWINRMNTVGKQLALESGLDLDASFAEDVGIQELGEARS